MDEVASELVLKVRICVSMEVCETTIILLVRLPPVGNASGRASYLGARGGKWGREIREAQKYSTYGFP